MDLRARYQWLTVTLTVLALVTAGLLLLTTRLLAQGVVRQEAIPVLNWLSFSGVAALVGVAVQWGATRERLKDVHTLRSDFGDRFDRIERQIDRLYEILGAERRHLDRHEFGLRTPNPEANP